LAAGMVPPGQNRGEHQIIRQSKIIEFSGLCSRALYLLTFNVARYIL
jgi:hypothetical protein